MVGHVARSSGWAHGLAALVLLLLAPAGPGAASALDDVLTVALPGDLRSTNPGVNRDSTTDWVLHHVAEGLVAYDARMIPSPMLADSWAVGDAGRTYAFHLRQGVRFHNGAPLTSAEVAWSWRRLLDPRTRWLCRSWFDGTGNTGIHVTAIETPAADRIVFRLARPNALFLARMAHTVCLSAILHPDSLSADGQWRAPIGTGPFSLGEWRRGRHVELHRFAGYRSRGEPRSGYAGAREALVGTVRLLVVPDPSSARLALESGALDVLPGVAPEVLPQLAARDDLRLVSQETLDWAVLLLRSEDPLLADARIRAAIAHAIDRRLVAQATLHNTARPNPSAVARQSTFFGAAHLQALPYDPRRARRLLEEAGYRGEPLTLQASRDHPLHFNDAIVIQAMLAQAGLRVRIESLDWATQFRNYSSGNYQLTVMGFSGRPDPTLMYEVFTGDRARRRNVVFGGREPLELLARSSELAEAPLRSRTFERLHALMVRDTPLVGLYNITRVDAVRKRVRGYEGWALGAPRLWGVALER